MLGMELEAQQRAATQTWYRDLAFCIFTVSAIVYSFWRIHTLFLPLEGDAHIGSELGIFSVIGAAFLAAWLKNEWRGLQFIRNRNVALNVIEFRIARARERLYNAKLMCLLTCCWSALLVLMLHDTRTHLLWFTVILPGTVAASTLARCRRKLRSLEA
jgi:hypothetical protein